LIESRPSDDTGDCDLKFQCEQGVQIRRDKLM
jgi:hypothetical protein